MVAHILKHEPYEFRFKEGGQEYTVLFADRPGGSHSVTVYKGDEPFDYRPEFWGGRRRDYAKYILEQTLIDKLNELKTKDMQNNITGGGGVICNDGGWGRDTDDKG